jgi:hypothetical protein
MRYLLIILLLASCSPTKRFNRLIDKYPYLITTDSITVHDTIRIVVPEVKVDTVVKVSSLLDTIYLQQDQLTVKVWMKGDDVFIEGKCDTVYIDKIIERKIPVRYYQKDTETFVDKARKFIVSFFIIFVLLYILYRIFIKRWK